MPCSELSVALKMRFTVNPRDESTSGKRAKAPVYPAYVEVSCLVPRRDGYYSPAAISERSAARLAHQSGGLGVPSSNLGAPTKNPRRISKKFGTASGVSGARLQTVCRFVRSSFCWREGLIKHRGDGLKMVAVRFDFL